MSPTKFIVTLTIGFLIFTLAKVYQYNLKIKKLYELQTYEMEVARLRHILNTELVELEKLRSPQQLIAKAKEKGFEATTQIHLLRRG